ncbi:MAG: hypothetical protein ACRDS9_28015 [Pseudonocardiaceae bacterium]
MNTPRPSNLQAPAGTTTDYVVIWFPPNGDREKKFGLDEDKARAHAGQPQIAEWNPILVLQHTTVTEEILPLAGHQVTRDGAPAEDRCTHCNATLPHQGTSWKESRACTRNERNWIV